MRASGFTNVRIVRRGLHQRVVIVVSFALMATRLVHLFRKGNAADRGYRIRKLSYAEPLQTAVGCETYSV